MKDTRESSGRSMAGTINDVTARAALAQWERVKARLIRSQRIKRIRLAVLVGVAAAPFVCLIIGGLR